MPWTLPSALTVSCSTLQVDDCLSTRLTKTRRRGVEETKRRRKYTGNWRSREDEKDKVCLCILPTLFSAPTASSSTLQADNCLSSRLRGMTRGDEEAYRPTRQPWRRRRRKKSTTTRKVRWRCRFSFLFFFAFPNYISGVHHFWVRFLRMWPFFNPTIKVVTFCLRGWCVLGVFLLPAFTCLGHERQDLLSLCDEMHVCTD